MTQNTKKRVKAVEFQNWTQSDFTHTWDGIEYTFKKGTTTLLEEGLAIHFARHLAVRELNNDKNSLDTTTTREVLMKKCLAGSIEAEDKKQLETKMLNKDTKKPFCTECDSKGVTHKKDCPVGNKLKADKEVSELEASEVAETTDNKADSTEEFEGVK